MSRLHSCKRCQGVHVTSDTGIAIACADSDHALVRWGGGTAPVSRQEGRIMAALLAKPGAPHTTRELIDYLWGDDPEGGPDCAYSHVRVCIHRLRIKLAAANFPGRIDVRYSIGAALVMEAA